MPQWSAPQRAAHREELRVTSTQVPGRIGCPAPQLDAADYAGRNRAFARNGSTWGRTRSLRHSAAGWIKPGNDTNCAPGISEAVCRAGLWIGSALPAYISVGTAIVRTTSENPLVFSRSPCRHAIKAAVSLARRRSRSGGVIHSVPQILMIASGPPRNAVIMGSSFLGSDGYARSLHQPSHLRPRNMQVEPGRVVLGQTHTVLLANTPSRRLSSDRDRRGRRRCRMQPFQNV